VELAQLKYMMPRLAEFDDSLSRLTGGIGGRGPGETSLEVNRRRVKDRIRHLEDKLEGVCRSRRQRRARRQRHSVPVISIVGYTNAGKSTLVNALTQAGVLVEDKLFATLDPVSRRLRLSPEREVLVSDTVGFIRDLPEELVEAFRATLEEIEDSALLIHLADAASPLRDAQIAAVDNILAGIGLGDIPRLLVLNKADRLDAWHREALARRYDATVISALRGEGLDTLLETVRRRLANGKATAWAETSAVNEGENS
jgi:GTP-binding protein HflX